MKRSNFPPLKFTPHIRFGESSQSDWYRYVNDEKDPGGFEVKFINADIGKGVFVTELKRSGSFLLEYHGALITREEGLRREKSYPLSLGSFLFFFKVGRKEQCIDATFSKNCGRFVNDGTGQDRNAEARVVLLKKVPHIAIIAIKNILPGQEIRYDYGVQDLPWRKPKSQKDNKLTIPDLLLCDIVKHSNCKTHKQDGIQRDTIKETDKVHRRHKQWKSSDLRNSKRETPIVEADNTCIDKNSIDVVSASRGETLNICQNQTTEETNAAPAEAEKIYEEFATSKHGNSDKSDTNSEADNLTLRSEKQPEDDGTIVLRVCRNRTTEETNAAPAEAEKIYEEFATSKHGNSDKSDTNSEADNLTLRREKQPEDDGTIVLRVCRNRTTEETNAAPAEAEKIYEEFATSKHGNSDKSDTNSEADNLTLRREMQPEDDGTIVLRVCRNREMRDAAANDFNPGSELQKKRRKGGKPYRPCPFCLKYRAKLKNHLESEHKSRKEVKHAMSLPPLERTNAFANLRKLGIYKENIRLIREKGAAGYADLIRERRQGEDSPIMCVGCKAFVSKKQFYRHRKLCSSASFSSPPRSLDPRFLANMKKNEFYATYQSEVLDRFRGDDVGELCKEDPYITAYGYHKYLAIGKRKRKKDEKRKSLMSAMRRISRLYLDFKAIRKYETTASTDMFLRENKESFKETIFSRKNSSNADSNLMDGFTIKKFANFLHDMFADNGDDDRVDQTNKFLRTLSYNWRELFGEAECEVLINRSHSRKPKNLPAEEDVQKLRIYILQYLKKMTSDTYVFIAEAEFTFLRDLLVTRLTLFNARRGGEPSRLTLDEWQDAKNDVWLAKLSNETKDPEELHLLQEFKVSYQAGKDDSKLVPVIFPADCIAGIELLTDKSIRKDAGVHHSNVYLFPRIHLSEFHVIGTASIDSICRRAGVKPITATKMRHRAATIYAEQDVDQRERQAFFTHMGHGDNINRNVYQCPPAFLEVTKVGKFLRHLDKAVSGSGKTSSESTSGCSRAGNLEHPLVDSDDVSHRLLSQFRSLGKYRLNQQVGAREFRLLSQVKRKQVRGFREQKNVDCQFSEPAETSSESTSGCSRVPAIVTVSEPGEPGEPGEISSESTFGCSRVPAFVTVSEPGGTSSEPTSECSRVPASVTAPRMAARNSQHREETATGTSQHRQESRCFAGSESSACLTSMEASSQDEENEIGCNEDHLLTARKDSSLRATTGDEIDISSTQDILPGRQYISWSKEDTAKVNSYFSKCVYDVSRFDKRGILPGYTEIRRFLKRYPDLLPQLPLDLKLKTIHTKLFNERNKSRRIAENKMPKSS